MHKLYLRIAILEVRTTNQSNVKVPGTPCELPLLLTHCPFLTHVMGYLQKSLCFNMLVLYSFSKTSQIADFSWIYSINFNPSCPDASQLWLIGSGHSETKEIFHVSNFSATSVKVSISELVEVVEQNTQPIFGQRYLCPIKIPTELVKSW